MTEICIVEPQGVNQTLTLVRSAGNLFVMTDVTEYYGIP